MKIIIQHEDGQKMEVGPETWAKIQQWTNSGGWKRVTEAPKEEKPKPSVKKEGK